MSFLSNLFSSSNATVVNQLSRKVEQINALEKEFEAKSQDELKALTTKWKSDLSSLRQGSGGSAGASRGGGAALDLSRKAGSGSAGDDTAIHKYLDNILPQAFAAVREAAKRTIGQRHYDVQLLGGMVLHSGSIAEMRTGEGKTLVATLPMYLNALAGRGVHLITVNDYLS